MYLNGNGHNGQNLNQPHDKQPDNMRSYNEIAYAHDMLNAIMKDMPDVRELLEEQPQLVIKICRDVLCWVLRHDNDSFEVNLNSLEELITSMGYKSSGPGN